MGSQWKAGSVSFLNQETLEVLSSVHFISSYFLFKCHRLHSISPSNSFLLPFFPYIPWNTFHFKNSIECQPHTRHCAGLRPHAPQPSTFILLCMPSKSWGQGNFSPILGSMRDTNLVSSTPFLISFLPVFFKVSSVRLFLLPVSLIPTALLFFLTLFSFPFLVPSTFPCLLAHSICVTSQVPSREKILSHLYILQ